MKEIYSKLNQRKLISCKKPHKNTGWSTEIGSKIQIGMSMPLISKYIIEILEENESESEHRQRLQASWLRISLNW